MSLKSYIETVEPTLQNSIRTAREALGWSQQTLADQVGVSRQAIVAIEGGRQVPQTTLALQLAEALGRPVSQLFRLGGSGTLQVTLATPMTAPGRVALGHVAGRWVAHPLGPESPGGADGVWRPDGVEPLGSLDEAREQLLVAGCAPLLGAACERLGARYRARWIHAGSDRALELLDAGLVHVAGIHLGSADHHRERVLARFGARPMALIHLTRWQQGLVVPEGNPAGLSAGSDLVRPGLTVALREPGASATRLIRDWAERVGFDGVLRGPTVSGHVDVARAVHFGAADVGVAIEHVALAAGLGFVGLANERFDLVCPVEALETPMVARLIGALDHRGFRTEVSLLGGYDPSESGHVTTIQ